MVNPLPPYPEPFVILGHRGSPARQPENSLPSFREAINSGADGFETDLRRTHDGRQILFHDDILAGQRVESFEFAELRRAVPSIALLGDLHEFEGYLMVLEVKETGWERELCTTIRSWEGIVVSSFDHRVLQDVRNILGDLPGRIDTGAIVDGYLVDCAAYLTFIGARWFFPHFQFIDAPLVRSLHDQGIRVVPWTVNGEEGWQKARQLGCDGVITDTPAEAVMWRRGQLPPQHPQ